MDSFYYNNKCLFINRTLILRFIFIFFFVLFCFSLTEKAFIVCVLLGNFNACVNPWIYVLFSNKMLRKFCPCCSNAARNQQKYATIHQTRYRNCANSSQTATTKLSYGNYHYSNATNKFDGTLCKNCAKIIRDGKYQNTDLNKYSKELRKIMEESSENSSSRATSRSHNRLPASSGKDVDESCL